MDCEMSSDKALHHSRKNREEKTNTTTTRSNLGLWEIYTKREWEHKPTISKEACIFEKQMAY